MNDADIDGERILGAAEEPGDCSAANTAGLSNAPRAIREKAEHTCLEQLDLSIRIEEFNYAKELKDEVAQAERGLPKVDDR